MINFDSDSDSDNDTNTDINTDTDSHSHSHSHSNFNLKERHVDNILEYKIDNYISTNTKLTKLITDPTNTSNLYIYKLSTGIGGTHLILSDKKNHTIIVTPNLGPIKGKEKDYNEKPYKYNDKPCFFIYGYSKYNFKDVRRFLKDNHRKKISLMITPEQFEKLLKEEDNFNLPLNTFNLFLDEVHKMVQSFRKQLKETMLKIISSTMFKRIMISTATPFIIKGSIRDIHPDYIDDYIFLKVQKKNEDVIDVKYKVFKDKKEYTQKLIQLITYVIEQKYLPLLISNDTSIALKTNTMVSKRFPNYTPHFLCGETQKKKLQPKIDNNDSIVGSEETKKIDFDDNPVINITSSYFEGYDIEKDGIAIIDSSTKEKHNFKTTQAIKQSMGRIREILIDTYLLIDDSVDMEKLKNTNQADKYFDDTDIVKTFDTLEELEDYFFKPDKETYYDDLYNSFQAIEYFSYRKINFLKKKLSYLNINLIPDHMNVKTLTYLPIKGKRPEKCLMVRNLIERYKDHPYRESYFINTYEDLKNNIENEKYVVKTNSIQDPINTRDLEDNIYENKQSIGSYNMKVMFVYFFTMLYFKYPYVKGIQKIRKTYTRDSSFFNYLKTNKEEISNLIDPEDRIDLEIFISDHYISKLQTYTNKPTNQTKEILELYGHRNIISLLLREQPRKDIFKYKTDKKSRYKFLDWEHQVKMMRIDNYLNPIEDYLRKEKTFKNKLTKQIKEMVYEDLKQQQKVYDVREYYEYNKDSFSRDDKIEEYIESLINNNIFYDYRIIDHPFEGIKYEKSDEENKYVFRTRKSMIHQFKFTITMFLSRGRGTYDYECKEGQDRIYNYFVNLPTFLRYMIPFDLIEYDISSAFPRFVSDVYGLEEPRDLYNNLSESLKIPINEAKIEYQRMLNNHYTKGNMEQSQKQYDFFHIHCRYPKEVVSDIIKDIQRGKGYMFQQLVKKERIKVEEAQSIIQRQSPTKLLYQCRLHDGVFLLRDQLTDEVIKKIDDRLKIEKPYSEWSKKEIKKYNYNNDKERN